MAMWFFFRICLIAVLFSSVLSDKPSIHGFPLKDGEITSIEKVPYHVSLLYYGWIFICSGIIVSEKIILTAAHCTMGNPTQWLVHVGSIHKTEEGAKYAVDKIVIHEEYYNGDSDYDISLFVTIEKIAIDGVTTAIIPMVPPDYVIPDDVTEGFSSAWGATGSENVTDLLQEIYFPILKHSECVEAYSTHEEIKISENVLCAGLTEETCQGDTGAPLTIDCFLVGVSSNGVGCAGKGLPGIWIKISVVGPWIQEWIDREEQ